MTTLRNISFFRALALFGTLALFPACHHAPAATTTPADGGRTKTAAIGVDPALKRLHFDYARDPACGMPLHAGLLDTLTYKGKLYGFCSKECKEAFGKDPGGYLAQIK